MGSVSVGSALMLCAAVSVLVPGSLVLGSEADPTHVVRTDRYTLAAITPTRAQTNPLEAVVEIVFSSDIGSVGDALKELLADTGYSLNEALDITAALYQQPLPTPHTALGPITVLQALQVLIGSAWAFEVDSVMRTISPYLTAQHHLRYDELKQRATPPHAVGSHVYFVAFRSGFTRNLKPAARAVIETAAQDYRNARTPTPPAITVTGISHSQGNTARDALAGARAERVAHLLVQAGVPHAQIKVTTDVATLRQTPRSGAQIAFATPAATLTATPVSGFAQRTRLPYLQIEPGSLRTAAERVVAEHGYRIAHWQVEPIPIEIGFAVRNDRIENALDDLLRPYPVSAQIIRHTHKIVVTGQH